MLHGPAGGGSPIARHSSTPQELKERLMAERSGEPHLIFRDASGSQVIRLLDRSGPPVTIGRRLACDVALEWDPEVSRVHAELQLVGNDWTLVDDGLSRNGSFLNGDRLQGRNRLRDGDTFVVGRTAIVFRSPAGSSDSTTKPGRESWIGEPLTPADRRVLVALCRPLKDPSQVLPASNQHIAQEVCVSIPAVKRRLSGLFVRFGLDHLPQSEKRTRLALTVLQSGVVSMRDL